MPPDAGRLPDLFAAARDRGRADRATFLDRECGPDADLRRRLDGLLAAWDAALAGPGPSPTPAAPGAAFDLASPVGTVVAGRYRVEREIGEGGMGTVYQAEQVAPVRRVVALKLIRAGMDTRQVLARFEAERQALAIMDHPHIARVLDAGTTEQGRPFFAMELVRGVPLTDYCDEHRLDLPARLELFRLVCSAVQHAHQKGVIHRDLKPSNILVEDRDGVPVPKVIDFGLAKAIGGAQLAERTVFTAHGVIHGTPRYMAPEQATYHAVDVDTRADIYALGVILYELLTGSTPIRPESVRQAALDEVLRVVREEEPPAPSDRIGSSGSLPSLAAVRHVEPARLGRLVRGDLDRVVLKALAKERERRYDSAVGLADDLGRFLRDEPVAAGSPSAAYRLRKFVRRHRGQVAAASLLALALLGGVAGTGLGLVEARRHRAVAVAEAQRAEGALRAESEQRGRAERRLAQIEKINAVLGSIFADLDPRQIKENGRPLGALLGERLDQASAQVQGEAIGDPLAVARMQVTLGRSQRGLGHAVKAVPLIERGQEGLARALGADDPEALRALYDLAVALRDASRGGQAIATLERAWEAQKGRLGPDHVDAFRSATLLAVLLYEAGRAGQGIALLERALPFMEAALGPDHPETMEGMSALGYCYMNAGRFDEALRLIRRALELQEAKLGPDHPSTIETMTGLGFCLDEADRPAEAIPILERARDLARARYGPDHVETILLDVSLAGNHRRARRYDKAVAILERGLPLVLAKLGPDHFATLRTQNELAINHQYAGRVDLATPIQAEVLKRQMATLGPDHTDTLLSMSNLGIDYKIAGDFGRAIDLLERALGGQQVHQGQDHPLTLSTMTELAGSCMDSGKLGRAEELYREALAIRRRRPDTGAAVMANNLAHLGWILLQKKDWAGAEPLLREALAIREAAQPDAWTTHNARSMLGEALLGRGQVAEAEAPLRAGFEGMKRQLAGIPPEGRSNAAEALDRLVKRAEASGQPAEAQAWRDEKARLFAPPPPADPDAKAPRP